MTESNGERFTNCGCKPDCPGCAKLWEEREQARAELAALREAALRLLDGNYPAWATSGGPNECEHGRAAGIPCRACDAVTVRASGRGGGA